MIATPHNPDALQALAERIRGRRTTRLFLKQPVSRRLILDAIEVARWAPNHHLTQPWEFYLLGEDTRAAAVELTRLVVTELKGEEIGTFKAESAATMPGWLVLTCRKSGDSMLEREDYASCCCALQNLMLYLSEAGLASKWATGPITRDRRFFELLGADYETEFVVGLLWYGYPKILPEQCRKSVQAITRELP